MMAAGDRPARKRQRRNARDKLNIHFRRAGLKLAIADLDPAVAQGVDDCGRAIIDRELFQD